MEPASIDQVAALVQAMYERIWTDWYQDLPGAEKATVKTYLADDSAGFSRSKNLLLNPICEGNLEDRDILQPEGWPIWKIQLVHEMLHEWQFKKPCIPTPAAVALHQQCLRRNFSGDGHGPDFFQAIIEKAPYFNMTPLELFQRI